MRRFLPLLALLALVLSGCSLGTPTPATSISDDGATLNGDVSSNQGGEVTYWFEYGTTTEYGTVTPDRTLTFPEGHTTGDPALPASETISGLQPATTYHYRICTSPGAQPGSRGCVDQDQSFTTDSTHVDTTVGDFGAGTTGADTYVGATGSGDDGEVVLRPTVGEEFAGGSLPTGWGAPLWNPGGGVTLSSGIATIDGALLRTDGFFGPGGSIEFVGAFSGDPFQHIGLGDDLNGQPWAIFSTGGGPLEPALYARTSTPTGVENTLIEGVSAAEPHRYRVVWTATQVEFFVDGTSVATHAATIAAQMRPVGSDFNAGGGAVSWHWARLSPFSTSGAFLSRVVDSGQAGTSWTTLDATTSGTAVTIETRSGDTAEPDGTWSVWAALGTGGAIASPDARYLQYRATLTTEDDARSPALERVQVNYQP